MKGQTEIVSFILLFLISSILVFSAAVWANNIFQSNVDANKISAAESFINALDSRIQSVARFGGSNSLDFSIAGTLKLEEGIIEFSSPVSIELPAEWIYLNKSAFSTIREKREGKDFRLQLFYNPEEIDLFTEGTRIVSVGTVTIEKNETINGIVRIELKFE